MYCVRAECSALARRRQAMIMKAKTESFAGEFLRNVKRSHNNQAQLQESVH